MVGVLRMINYPNVGVDIQKSILIGYWNDSLIPIFHVPSMHALNQLIGYVKHINAKSGTVLYRGQCDLYQSVTPSICHDRSSLIENQNLLQETIEAIRKENALMNFFGFRNKQVKGWELYENLIVEAALQHYGAKTYCVDFVDNHWTALWFGLNRWVKNSNQYIIRNEDEKDIGRRYISFLKTYCRQSLPPQPSLDDINIDDDKINELKEHASHGNITFEEVMASYRQSTLKKLNPKWKKQCNAIQTYNHQYDSNENTAHLYLFLYVAETNSACVNGLYMGEKTYTVDLRKALPSTFLRTCSQHGWIVRGIDSDFDFNSNICCVIRINVSLAKQMLGNGSLLSQENFFPNENVDQGYNILLLRQKGSRLETKHNKVIPAGMLPDFYGESTSKIIT